MARPTGSWPAATALGHSSCLRETHGVVRQFSFPPLLGFVSTYHRSSATHGGLRRLLFYLLPSRLARSILPLQRVFLHEKIILCSVWQSLMLPWKIQPILEEVIPW